MPVILERPIEDVSNKKVPDRMPIRTNGPANPVPSARKTASEITAGWVNAKQWLRDRPIGERLLSWFAFQFRRWL